jgi:hypothetical protein
VCACCQSQQRRKFRPAGEANAGFAAAILKFFMQFSENRVSYAPISRDLGEQFHAQLRWRLVTGYK